MVYDSSMTTTRVSAVCAFVLAATATACVPFTVERWEREPIPPAGTVDTKLADGPVFHLDRVRLHSTYLDDARFFLALVPNGPEPIEAVVILNHGFGDRPEALLKHMPIERVYADLLRQRAVSRAVLILPDIQITMAYRRAHEHKPINLVTQFVVEEVAPLAARKYGVALLERDRWSIGGFSFGGHVALDAANRFSGRFGSAVVVSSFFEPFWKFWPDPAQPRPRLLLACGSSDRFYRQMTDLHGLFTSSGLSHEWVTGPGGHTWEYWSSVLERMLRFQIGRTPGGPTPR